MGILDKLFGRQDAAKTDARRIYTKLMSQSRHPNFYGEARMPDNYDGRIDILTVHISAILSNLKRFDANGERLGQAIFDEMKDDFEVALREEALSDASVKKRIQPMISLFYDRVKCYVEALNDDQRQVVLKESFSDILEEYRNGEAFRNDRIEFSAAMAGYLDDFDQSLSELDLGQIALAEFVFPSSPN